MIIPIIVVILGALGYCIYRVIQATKEKSPSKKKSDLILWGSLSGVSGVLLLISIGAWMMVPEATPKYYSRQQVEYIEPDSPYTQADRMRTQPSSPISVPQEVQNSNNEYSTLPSSKGTSWPLFETPINAATAAKNAAKRLLSSISGF